MLLKCSECSETWNKAINFFIMKIKNLITKTNQNWRVKVNTDEGWGWEDWHLGGEGGGGLK